MEGFDITAWSMNMRLISITSEIFFEWKMIDLTAIFNIQITIPIESVTRVLLCYGAKIYQVK